MVFRQLRPPQSCRLPPKNSEIKLGPEVLDGINEELKLSLAVMDGARVERRAHVRLMFSGSLGMAWKHWP